MKPVWLLAVVCAALGACATAPKAPPPPPPKPLTFLQQLEISAAKAPKPLPQNDGFADDMEYCEFMEMTYGPGAGGC